jgi:hypothetical protein
MSFASVSLDVPIQQQQYLPAALTMPDRVTDIFCLDSQVKPV